MKSVIFFTVTFFATNFLLAQAPKSLELIPKYPSSTRDLEAEMELKKEYEATKDGGVGEQEVALTERKFVIFRINEGLEKIFNFYLNGLKAITASEDLSQTSNKAVVFTISFYNEDGSEFFDDIEQEPKYYGSKKRQVLLKTRKPYESEKWIKEAAFNWVIDEKDSDKIFMSILIEDVGFEKIENEELQIKETNYSTYKPSTLITILSEAYKPGDEIPEAFSDTIFAESDIEVEQTFEDLKIDPPTEAKLGLKIYPGSTFDAQSSAEMSLGDENVYYVFSTKDPLDKVVKFFERTTEKKAKKENSNIFIIPLKGNFPYSQEEITIRSETILNSTNSLIIIKK